MNGPLKGHGRSLGIGTVCGIVVAGIAFVGMHMSISDRLRNDGASSATITGRISGVETRVGRLEGIHERQENERAEFLRLLGELPGLRTELVRLNVRLDRLDERLNKMEGKTSMLEDRTLREQHRKIGDQR